MQPTVVSAYYPIKSKFGAEKYVQWMMNFWPKTQHPLVFFTDPAIVPVVEGMFKDRAGPTRIVGLPFKELAAFQKMSASVWIDTHGKDREATTHTPELYAIWYEKKEFVLRAIKLNPFGSEHFVWCDAGICRYPEWVPHLQAFPRAQMIPPGDRMLVLRINEFTATEPEKDGILGNVESVNSVGGGILAASAVGWARWNDAYDRMFMRYIFADRFVGKDQNIMASMCLEQPDLVHLIDPPAAMNSMQRWFYLLFFLAGVHVV
jgi:hypothetical protein